MERRDRSASARGTLIAPASTKSPLRPGIALPALALAAAGTSLLGFRLGAPWLLPVLDAAPVYASLVLALRAGQRRTAIFFVLWWAACLGVTKTILSAADPWGTASEAVLHGPAYFEEMRLWVATGTGCESSPACFLPQHLLHGTIFAAAALLTAGAAALVMGAFLMNYMAFYVGTLAASAVFPACVAAVGWHPWSLLRIVAFVIFGVILAEPLLSRLWRLTPPPGRARWAAAAGALFLGDIILKALLAPRWAVLLRGLLDG